MANSEGIWSCVTMISNGEKYVPIRAERISMKDGLNILIGKNEWNGLYWFKDEENNIIGIDNTSYEMWVEEFTSIGDCIRWLQREDF